MQIFNESVEISIKKFFLVLKKSKKEYILLYINGIVKMRDFEENKKLIIINIC